MDFGRKVMNLRLDRGVCQQELAEACGIAPGRLSRLETGINRPKSAVTLAVARHLGLPVEYLLDESQPYPHQPPEKPQVTRDGMVWTLLLEAFRAAPLVESLVGMHRLLLGGKRPGKKA